MAHSRALARAVFVVLAAGSLATKYPYGKDKYCFWGVGTGWCSGTGYTWCLLTDYCDVNADCAGDNYCPWASTWSSCKQDWWGYGKNGCCTKDRVCPAAPVAPSGCSWSCGSADCCDYAADKSCAAGLTVRTVGWSTCNNGLAANKDFYVCCEPPKAKSGGGGGGGGGAAGAIAGGVIGGLVFLCCCAALVVFLVTKFKRDNDAPTARVAMAPQGSMPFKAQMAQPQMMQPQIQMVQPAQPQIQIIQPQEQGSAPDQLPAASKFCGNCGNPLAAGARFCGSCGQAAV